MQITTGFGYYHDADGHIISKYILSIGWHPDPAAGLTQVEVANQTALNAVVIYTPPLTALQKFSVTQFQIDLLANFGSNVDILPYYSVIRDLAAFENFAGMSMMVSGLLGAGKVTSDEVNTLVTILAGQCIYFNDFS